MSFTVERHEADGSKKKVELTAVPDDTTPWADYPYRNEPVSVPGLGLTFHLRTTIAAVKPDSPAARAGLEVGQVINAMSVPRVPSEDDKTAEKRKELTFDDNPRDWPRAFQLLQLAPLQEIELTVNHSDRKVKITPEPVSDWFNPNRGLQFQALIRKLAALGATAAVERGWDETIDSIQTIYATIRSLVQRRVSPKNLGGPILIAQVAFSAAGSGLNDLIRFLGFLSINLAVLNFLPIPPLDGGQMLFLIAEKVRGKPLPDSALIAGTYVGLLLVLGLMVFVIFQDVARIVIGHS
jgi:regulator of sigma E protease